MSGPWLSLPQLSASERFRLGIAFHIALALATGIDCVVIDRADLLDREQRRALTKVLLERGLDQAFVLATSDESPTGRLPEGVRFIDLAGPEHPSPVRPAAR
jgi:hypothetical protein